MSVISDEKLLEIVNETLSWGDEVAEKWAGTLYEKQIDTQKAIVTEAVEHKDFKKIEAVVGDLAQLLDYAEREYETVA